MSFLAPLLLAGAAAIGIPIALHFLFKAWYKPLPWAAMDFLRKSLEQTTRRIKFRELILLLLRCLCLALLALALARPIVGLATGTGQNESVNAILVLDTSYSMGAREGGTTRFERAKDEAIRVIDDLPNNSTVQVIACSDRASAIPFTPSNLDQARNVIRNLKLTGEAGDLGPGLTEAEAALERVQGANREVHVFSDFQRNGFDGNAGTKWNDLKARVHNILVRCAEPSLEKTLKNVTILDIRFPDSIPPHAGTRLPFTVLLKNTGKTPILNVEVSLQVDGQSRQNEQPIDTGLAPEIAPGATFPVTMTASLSRAGLRMLTATVGVPKSDGIGPASKVSQPDDLPGDNRFDKLILVRQAIHVLIVDGRPDPRDPKESASHFVRNAIVPVATSQQDDYFIRAKVVPVEQLPNEKLADYQICVLANVPASADDKPGIAALDDKTVQSLKKFVTDGGGLVIGSGDFLVPASYNRVLGSAGANLLPFDLTPKESRPVDRPMHPTPDSAENPSFLSRLRVEPFSSISGSVDVFSVLGTQEVDRAISGHVLLRLDNQLPLITAKNVGAGEVVFVHTSLDATWTNWPAKATSFVGTFLFTLSHLSGKADRGGNRVAGEKYNYTPLDSAKDYELLKPDGSRSRLPKPVGGSDSSKPTITVSETAVAGEYQIVSAGGLEEDPPRFAVIPDLRESENLELMTDADIGTKLGFTPLIRNIGSKSDLVESVRSQREWTVPVLVLLFLFVLLEGFWAWSCGRAL